MHTTARGHPGQESREWPRVRISNGAIRTCDVGPRRSAGTFNQPGVLLDGDEHLVSEHARPDGQDTLIGGGSRYCHGGITGGGAIRV